MTSNLLDRLADTKNRLEIPLRWRWDRLKSAAFMRMPIATQRRPRLLMLADVRGWAFDDLCQQRAHYLAPTWEVDLVYLKEDPSVDPGRYDLMFNPNWSFSRYDEMFRGRYVRGINSHKWERFPRPYQKLRECLQGAVACVVPNVSQVRRIQAAFPPTFLVKEGIDPLVFRWLHDRSDGNLVAGWTGNQANQMKRLDTVIRPACLKAGVELKVADTPTRVELNLFYNEVDIVLIASEPLYEGNPLSLFEAGACGRTVIATKVGAVPEMVDDGSTGLIVEATDDISQTVEVFAQRLRWCREHLNEVRIMGKRLREKVLRERTPEATCEQFRQAIEWAYGHSCKAEGY